MRLLPFILLALLSPAALAQSLPAPEHQAPPLRNRNILITGYWPPTNEMLRPWSPNPTQNPGGWIGENWEGRGFNLHAHFPEFPGGTGSNPRGNGDFEVDYQDTFADFNRIVDELKPIAIVSFSRANTQIGWEMEPAYTRFRLTGETTQVPGRTIPTYTNDYFGVRQPVEVANVPLGEIRVSNLPMQQIVTAVDAAFTSTQLSPFIANYNPANPNAFDFGGAFLSGYLPFLAAGYREANDDNPFSPTSCLMTGHVHVGQQVNVAVGTQAAAITMRQVISTLQWMVVPSPGAVAILALLPLASRRRR
jgi:hypothetical protein